jgi:hypothetical protein
LAIRRKNELSEVRIANSSLIYPRESDVIPNKVRDLLINYFEIIIENRHSKKLILTATSNLTIKSGAQKSYYTIVSEKA